MKGGIGGNQFSWNSMNPSTNMEGKANVPQVPTALFLTLLALSAINLTLDLCRPPRGFSVELGWLVGFSTMVF